MSRKLLVLSLLLSLSLSSVCFAVSTADTNLDVLDNGKSLYGEKVNGQGKQLIGINGSDVIKIDDDGVGVQFDGSTTFSDDLIADLFVEVDPASAVDTSATTDATITPVSTYQLVDTHQDVSVSTANLVATANIENGTIVIFQTSAAARDVVFLETGNLDLGGTRTLSDPRDKLMLIKSGADQWDELSYVDNN